MRTTFKKKVDVLIYNLIYPAFLGNMVYDIILFLEGEGKATLTDTLIRSSILIFTIIDFMHLYGDMNDIVKTPEKKSVIYLFCDFITSICIFISFALVVKHHRLSLFLLSIIPLIVLFYKYKNPYSKKFFKPYAIISFILGLSAFFINENFLGCYQLIISFLTTLIYGIFVFYYYDKNCLEFDIKYISENKEY